MISKLSCHLTARVIGNKAISLSVNSTNITIKLLGSTMITSTNVAGEYENGNSQITIYPEQGKDGIVAVSVAIGSRDSKGRNDWDYVPAFLKVSWKEKDGQKYPFIDLDEPWIPADRVGQVMKDTAEVMLGNGRRFCTVDRFKWEHNKGKTLPGYVPDGNLLCRYLWGTASAVDVLHAAVQQRLEPTLRKQVERLTDELRKSNLQSSRHANAEHSLEVRLREANNKVRELENSCLEAIKALDKVTMGLMRAVPLYRLVKRLPACIRPKFLNGFVEAMDGVKSKSVTA